MSDQATSRASEASNVAGGAVDCSIIVPAYREAENLRPLVTRIGAALTGRAFEIIIVDDDSGDGTERLAAELSAQFPVRLIVRKDERGLSGAVLRGFEEARGDVLIVMDADLQHPAEVLPDFIAKFEDDSVEFVMGTRYSRGGEIAEDWSLGRRLGSRGASLLALPLAPVSDPMSGFFALRRSVWQRAENLDPIGYKIALELLVKSRAARIEEVPIRFATRVAGESKASLAEMLRYLKHLRRLYAFRRPAVLPLLAALAVVVLAALAWLVWRTLS